MDQVHVSGPVKIDSGSKEQVALDLLRLIAPTDKCTQDRNYYLNLYRQCLLVVYGNPVEESNE